MKHHLLPQKSFDGDSEDDDFIAPHYVTSLPFEFRPIARILAFSTIGILSSLLFLFIVLWTHKSTCESTGTTVQGHYPINRDYMTLDTAGDFLWEPMLSPRYGIIQLPGSTEDNKGMAAISM